MLPIGSASCCSEYYARLSGGSVVQDVCLGIGLFNTAAGLRRTVRISRQAFEILSSIHAVDVMKEFLSVRHMFFGATKE